MKSSAGDQPERFGEHFRVLGLFVLLLEPGRYVTSSNSGLIVAYRLGTVPRATDLEDGSRTILYPGGQRVRQKWCFYKDAVRADWAES
jgi:hypothetical protein